MKWHANWNRKGEQIELLILMEPYVAGLQQTLENIRSLSVGHAWKSVRMPEKKQFEFYLQPARLEARLFHRPTQAYRQGKVAASKRLSSYGAIHTISTG